jgi:hypothetical protein
LGGGLCASAPASLASTPPVIEEESVIDVAGTSVTLQARINPEGSQTTYRFEYGPSEAYGSSTPVPDALVGSGSSGVTVTVHIQGLSASSGYHFRVAASVPSRGETVDGVDGVFTTQALGGAFALPDGRQWELVSPPNKHGAPIGVQGEGPIQASETGDAMTYYAYHPTELEPRGYVTAIQLLSTRGAQGWSSNDIALPHSGATGLPIGQGTEYRFASADLSLGLMQPQGPVTQVAPEETERTPLIRHNSTCEAQPATCYTPLVNAANVPPGTKFDPYPENVGAAVVARDATPDLSHVILQTEVLGLTSIPGDDGGVYEWAEGKLQLVNIFPESEGGKPSPASERPGLGDGGSDFRHALSNDGSRVIWTDSLFESLYVRDTARGETVRVGTGTDLYETASGDASHIFFIGRETEGVEKLEVCDLVEVGGRQTCNLTVLASEPRGMEVLGVAEVSDDGSVAYFGSGTALAPGAVPGGFNLYVARRSGAAWGAPKLIGVLSSREEADKAWGLEPRELMARGSGDGRWFAFMSQDPLTGYDNRDAVSGQRDEEVYLYDAETERLMCASCNPTGARPTGAEYSSLESSFVGGQPGWPPSTWLAASVPAWNDFESSGAVYQPRYLSDSDRLFFDSHEALVPQDVNGNWDVYELEPVGVGGCALASATFVASKGACLALVSSGTSPEESAFMDASVSGNDVFFVADNQLAPEDFDTAFDVYDAHVCSTGSPCRARVAVPPPCTTGDACKAAPTPQPSIFGAAASATFSGTGNVTSTPPSKPTSRSLTRTQRLSRALRACRKKPKRARGKCERKARKRFGAKQAHHANPTTKGKG